MGTRMKVFTQNYKSWTLYVKDKEGNVENITDAKILFTVKTKKTDADVDAIISKTITSHTIPLQGVSKLILDENDTDVDAKKYWYSIKLITSGNLPETFGVGTFEVLQDISGRKN